VSFPHARIIGGEDQAVVGGGVFHNGGGDARFVRSCVELVDLGREGGERVRSVYRECPAVNRHLSGKSFPQGRGRRGKVADDRFSA